MHTALHTCPRNTTKTQVVVVDDLSNSVEESLARVRELTKCKDDQLIFRKVRNRRRETETDGTEIYFFCEGGRSRIVYLVCVLLHQRWRLGKQTKMTIIDYK